mgnify:CR=1 FL=1
MQLHTAAHILEGAAPTCVLQWSSTHTKDGIQLDFLAPLKAFLSQSLHQEAHRAAAKVDDSLAVKLIIRVCNLHPGIHRLVTLLVTLVPPIYASTGKERPRQSVSQSKARKRESQSMGRHTVYNSLEARCAPVGYCSRSIFGEAKGAISCDQPGRRVRTSFPCQHAGTRSCSLTCMRDSSSFNFMPRRASCSAI